MHARRTTLIFATHGAGAATGLVGLFFIGRFMSPEAYGAFGFALGFLGLWMVLADLGLDRSHARYVTLGEPLGDCVATYRGLKLAVSLLFVAVGTGAILVWRTSGRLTDATGLAVLVVVLAQYLFVILRSIPVGTFNALKLTASSQIMVLVEHAVKLPLLIAGALFFGFMTNEHIPLAHVADEIAAHSPFHRPMTPDEGGLLIALAWAAGMLASLGMGVLFTARHSIPSGRFDRGLARRYVLYAVPVALGASTRIVFSNVDAVFIGWFLSAENVGYYFAADRLSALALIVPAALSTVFFPILGELAARREMDVMNAVAGGIARALSILMVPVTLLFVLFPAEGIVIFLGDPFLPAARVLPLLAVYVLLLAFATVATVVGMVVGTPYIVVRAGVVALVVNVFLNFLLVPDALFGIRMFGFHSVGAALSTAVGQLVGLVVLTHDVRRLSGNTYFGRASFIHLGAGVVAGLVVTVLRPLIFGELVRVWELAIAVVVLVTVYLALLALFGELSKKDLLVVQDALHPRRMVAYVRDEMRDKRLP